MTDVQAPRYMHPGGRECVWKGGQWRYGRGNAYVCNSEHRQSLQECTDADCEVPGVHYHAPAPPIEIDVTKKIQEMANDRGEFGMPGIGNPGRVTWSSPDAFTEHEITHVPDRPVPQPVSPSFRMVITEDGISVEYPNGAGRDTDACTDDARYILSRVLPPLLDKFLIKNQKYAEAQIGFDLGAKGIVPDVNRKFSVVKRVLWDGGAEVDEDLDQVIDDLVGHLLLMRARLR